MKRRGPETERSHEHRIRTHFYVDYMEGCGLDIGYRGEHGDENIIPVLKSAIGVDLDYPGYDGVHLPFDDASQDYVYASHILEHIQDKNLKKTLREWYRVTRSGGHIIICVPHKDLYEKKPSPPSRWNLGHHRFYTPARLLTEIEDALPTPNSWRLRELYDNDRGYDYSLPDDVHANGCYEIVCVLEKR